MLGKTERSRKKESICKGVPNKFISCKNIYDTSRHEYITPTRSCIDILEIKYFNHYPCRIITCKQFVHDNNNVQSKQGHGHRQNVQHTCHWYQISSCRKRYSLNIYCFNLRFFHNVRVAVKCTTPVVHARSNKA